MEVTFKFRIYQYTNDLGETIFHVAEKACWGLYWAKHYSWSSLESDYICSRWYTRESLMNYLNIECNNRLKELIQQERYGRGTKLKLITIEDTSVTVKS
jgi:hypothetical protein